MSEKFWKSPKVGPKPAQWSPGEARSYIPVLNFRSQENTPAGGLVGRVIDTDGTRQVRFVTRGAKTEGTKKP